MLTYSYKDGNIYVSSLAPYNFECKYKNIATTYIAFNQDDALAIFLEALEDKRSVIYRLLKGGDSK